MSFAHDRCTVTRHLDDGMGMLICHGDAAADATADSDSRGDFDCDSRGDSDRHAHTCHHGQAHGQANGQADAKSDEWYNRPRIWNRHVHAADRSHSR